MTDILHSLQSGHTSLWLFIPGAILLGALHGLEPGHSKTMMAAFIIAVRGTIPQAILLGLSAALAHSAIIYVLAFGALEFGSRWNAENVEPYLQLGSAAGVFALALWMFFRTRREVREAHAHGPDGLQEDGHSHAHDESFLLETSAGRLELSIFEEGVPPVFRLRAPDGGALPAPAGVTLETVREGIERQSFPLLLKDGFLESSIPIPEPHEFAAILTVASGPAAQADFREAHHHHHEHDHDHPASGTEPFQDAHERAHAEDIRQRFASRTATTPQIILFGLTGGLLPCPAAFSVLLICLQLKRLVLGFTLVASFSFGLALTMVAAGVIAAWSVRHAQKRFSGFGEAMRRAPYVSCIVLVLIAGYMAWHGWNTLPHS